MLSSQAIEFEDPQNSGRKSVLRVKREIVVPKIKHAAEETKSILLLEDGQGVESLYARRVELFCLPTLIGFSFGKEYSFAETYVLAWNVLRERGFPIVPMAAAIGSDLVVTTNLVTDEKTSVYDRKIDAMEIRDTFPMDREFVKIPIEKIGKQAHSLSDLANKTGVELMPDGAFHVVINPDASWRTVFLDIGKVRIYANPRDLPSGARGRNGFYADRDLNGFSTAQTNILALRVARRLP